MIACVYEDGASVFVEPVITGLSEVARRRRVDLAGVCLDHVLEREGVSFPGISTVYVLPCESLLERTGDDLVTVLGEVFPKAVTANGLTAHRLCNSRVDLDERLIERGIPVPETLLTSSAEEARDFVKKYEHAILREPRTLGAGGGTVVFCDEAGTLVGETRGRRYVMELADGGIGRRLEHGVMSYPPPFLLQRLITRVGRRGVLSPAPVLRGFVVDDHVPFWVESYQDRVRRPSDFLLVPGMGANRRFIQVVSDEADKLVRRVAKVVGSDVAAVDLIRSDSGYVVLDVVTDGPSMIIDRSFKRLPDFRDAFDLDLHIGELLVARVAESGMGYSS